MRFQVPQFIETEANIIGPFTLKQFLFLTAGGLLIFVLQFVVSLTFLFILGIPIAILSFGLAFYRVDGVPLPRYLLMALSYATGAKKYHFTKESGGQYLPQK